MAKTMKELKEYLCDLEMTTTDHIRSMLKRESEWDKDDETKFAFLLGQRDVIDALIDKTGMLKTAKS